MKFHPAGQPVGDGVFFPAQDHRRLNLHAGYIDGSMALRQDQRDDAVTAAQVDNPIAWLDGNELGKQQRVDGDAIASTPLIECQPPAEQRIQSVR